MMSLLRNIPNSFVDVKNGNWNYEPYIGHQIKGLTIGIIGYGRLGKIMKQLFNGWGVDVLVNDPYDDCIGCNKVDKENLLKHSDVVFLHVHVTNETKEMVNEFFLSQMKKNSYLINTSRGEIVDEKAIMKYIKNGSLKGYGTDVIRDEYGNLYYPKTDKEKVPLIITIHPSTGFVPDHHFKFLNNLGIAVLDVQTFKSRGIDSQWEYIVSEEAAAIDAYAALDKISKDSRIDKNKVAVMGFSYGAMAVVNTHQKFFIDIIKPKNKFMAHIAYYPLCYLYKNIETSKAPLYIFIGEKDRLTPYEYCDDYSKKVIEGGGNSILKVFPKATHRFEWEKLKNPILISGESYTEEFISKTLDSSYPRYDIGKDVAEFTTPNGWSYFSLLSEENRKKKYKECCKIKRSLVEYNKNAASESNKIIKEIFDIK